MEFVHIITPYQLASGMVKGYQYQKPAFDHLHLWSSWITTSVAVNVL